jgi:uncharacterized membrane protein YhaH (DUF805 family)
MSNLPTEVLTEIVKEIREDVKEIKEQTKRTNGRVSRLEVWRGVLTGAILVIAAVVLPIFFDLIKLHN